MPVSPELGIGAEVMGVDESAVSYQLIVAPIVPVAVKASVVAPKQWFTLTEVLGASGFSSTVTINSVLGLSQASVFWLTQ